jgi:hypothetical protein
MPAEDFIGFVLGIAYVVIGVAFLRRPAGAPPAA